jgi:hypothetical protein
VASRIPASYCKRGKDFQKSARTKPRTRLELHRLLAGTMCLTQSKQPYLFRSTARLYRTSREKLASIANCARSCSTACMCFSSVSTPHLCGSHCVVRLPERHGRHRRGRCHPQSFPRFIHSRIYEAQFSSFAPSASQPTRKRTTSRWITPTSFTSKTMSR